MEASSSLSETGCSPAGGRREVEGREKGGCVCCGLGLHIPPPPRIKKRSVYFHPEWQRIYRLGVAPMQFGPGVYKTPLPGCPPQLSATGTGAGARGQRAPGKAAPPAAGREVVPPGRGLLSVGLRYWGGGGKVWV